MTTSSTPTDLGSYAWTLRTGGRLERRDRRLLAPDLARVHAANVAGRLRLAARLHPGRSARVDRERLAPPESRLARAALDVATRVLPASLANHGLRTYVFGRALGELEGLDVDADLLYAAALLHDVGLAVPTGHDDFTLTSARVAGEVAHEVGLSTAATETLQSAITRHHNPRVTPDSGAVAYLLAAGAGADVVGLRSWDLPRAVLTDAVAEHPREHFKAAFASAWAVEAARVPEGRARFLRRYGAFSLAIRLAPFSE